jgi:hypothetical protein
MDDPFSRRPEYRSMRRFDTLDRMRDRTRVGLCSPDLGELKRPLLVGVIGVHAPFVLAARGKL